VISEISSSVEAVSRTAEHLLVFRELVRLNGDLTRLSRRMVAESRTVIARADDTLDASELMFRLYARRR
jgi:hypothetical protein